MPPFGTLSPAHILSVMEVIMLLSNRTLESTTLDMSCVCSGITLLTLPFSLLHYRKTSHQKHAKAHRTHLEAHFSNIDAKQGTSFVKALLDHCPKEPEKKSKKRKSSESLKQSNKKKSNGEPQKTLADMTQSEREEYAMDNLRNYIQEVGGKSLNALSFLLV